MLDSRNGPPAVAAAERTLNPDFHEQAEGTRRPLPRQRRSTVELRRIAQTLADDGHTAMRVRVLAFNACHALDRGPIDPAVADTLISAYRHRRAEARAGARAFRR